MERTMTILPNKYRGIRAGTRSRTKREAPRLIVPDVPFECRWCGRTHAPWQSGTGDSLLVFYICTDRVQIGRIDNYDYTKYPPVGWGWG